MPRRATPSYAYVLVVVRHEGRFLLVQERKHGQTFYLPSGGVEAGESILAAAVRETQEEAGIRVVPRALIGMDQQWFAGGERGVDAACKWRFILTADPAGSTAPKSVADRHTLGARWVRREELTRLPLRSGEVMTLVDAVDRGARGVPIPPGQSLGDESYLQLMDWGPTSSSLFAD